MTVYTAGAETPATQRCAAAAKDLGLEVLHLKTPFEGQDLPDASRSDILVCVGPPGNEAAKRFEEVLYDMYPRLPVLVLYERHDANGGQNIPASRRFTHADTNTPYPLVRDLVVRLLRQAKHVATLSNGSIAEGGEWGIDQFIGKSEKIRKVRELVQRIGPTHSSILLQGENGTGKEVLARAIHDLSSRCGGPFVPVDCSALPASLAESELFGHVKGSFTGAIQNKLGLIEQGNGGTVFFDEIGEMSFEMQAKLLRVLQEHEIRYVGGTNVIHVDFRVIAATNKDLSVAVRENKFRQDLYYRLNVVAITIPPLRQRRDDIHLLANAFLKEFAGANPVPTIDSDTMKWMVNYHWPGNVRELRNLIERAVAIGSGPTIHLSDLDLGREIDSSAVDDQPERFLTIAEMEERALGRAMYESRGNVCDAARMLGIGKTTLYRKLKAMHA
jgi:transcriptional regulator with PAS, ATPase and Fis domain